MSSIITAKGLSKNYKDHTALDNVSFSVEPGRILGLIGPNGAGKTTLLKGILGLARLEGQLEVLGLDPSADRKKLLQDVSFIADTAILPRWLKVKDAIEYVAGVHPKFNREKANTFLEKTAIKRGSKVSDLSKGMITQLHLALVMAIDSRLLVLDEPTLGLDIVYRKQFYSTLLNDYFDADKTIIITTHQVEEVENILTDLIFIQNGKIVLDSPMEAIGERYVELQVSNAQKSAVAAAGFHAISEMPRLGGSTLLFEGVPAQVLSEYGDVRTPSVADLFVAKVSGGVA